MSPCYSHLLHQCKSPNSFKSIHAQLVVNASIPTLEAVVNKLLRGYFRVGDFELARKLFDEIPQPRNAFLYTSMIHGCAHNGLEGDAFLYFRGMLREEVEPVGFAVSAVLKAVVQQSGLIRVGESIHGLSLKVGIDWEMVVPNSLIDMYSRCGVVDVARRVFEGMVERDFVSWNSMICGYGNCGRCAEAKMMFDAMPEKNVVSWTAMVSAYIKAGDMGMANELFRYMPFQFRDAASGNVMITAYLDVGDVSAAYSIFDGMPRRDVGSWKLMIAGFCKSGDMRSAENLFRAVPFRSIIFESMMVDGYIKLGDLESARAAFDQILEKNLVSWSTMIDGYAQNGQHSRALELFKQFKKTGIRPDSPLVCTILSTCSQLGVLNTAENIVSEYCEGDNLSDVKLITALIDMYGKGGNVEMALLVFEQSPMKDLICYTTMIMAFASHGLSSEAVELFYRMIKNNVKPDDGAFVAVLTACSHGGLTSEGRRLFSMMIDEFKLKPSEKHYACMVDLLGRAGHLDEAYSVIEGMPIVPHSGVWGALLAACRVHHNVKLAEIAAEHLFAIEPDNSGNFILMSNIYAAAGKWNEVARIRNLIRESQVKKNRGSSWIELESGVHEFVTADVSHVDSDIIYFILSLLNSDMNHSVYQVNHFRTSDIPQ